MCRGGGAESKKTPAGGGQRAFYVGVPTRSGNQPTYGSEALIGRPVELSMTAVTVPCSAKTVNVPPPGFLKVYFSLYPLPPIPLRTIVGFPRRAMRSATLSPTAMRAVSSLPATSFPASFSAGSVEPTIGLRTPRLRAGVVWACSAVAEPVGDSSATCPLVAARSFSVGFGLAGSAADNSGVFVAGAALGRGAGAGVGPGL